MTTKALNRLKFLRTHTQVTSRIHVLKIPGR